MWHSHLPLRQIDRAQPLGWASPSSQFRLTMKLGLPPESASGIYGSSTLPNLSTINLWRMPRIQKLQHPTGHHELDPMVEKCDPWSYPTSNGPSLINHTLSMLSTFKSVILIVYRCHSFCPQLQSISSFSPYHCMDSQPLATFWFEATQSTYIEIKNSTLSTTFCILDDHLLQISRAYQCPHLPPSRYVTFFYS